jgi:hypothetical protein
MLLCREFLDFAVFIEMMIWGKHDLEHGQGGIAGRTGA